ncbi:hypothetical protein PHISCL_01553 [Aspergillus sclerotialis]|uniref:Uncharacterized protein n=1 Tax=Aspergillus sclerotialis TaxID=2070753 RepID=A0A3A2ZTR9_9EURO|nr:hypothetical protein PHISCL_01553 [Aspergillus sclerotialis]
MMLTPIKIRGRRKRPPKPTASEPTPKKLKPGERPSGGRRLLSIQEIARSSQLKLDRRTRLLTPRAVSVERSRFSTLESLPVELIERIFLYALNVNFPRASVVLNAAVSSERVYRVLVLLAFWDDSAAGDNVGGAERGGNGEVIERILRPLDYSPLDEEERGELQRTVLRCRWFSVNRLLDLLPDLMSLVIQRHWIHAGIRMEDDKREALNRFLGKEEDIRVFEGVDTDNNHWTLSVEPLVSVTIRNEVTGQQQTHRVLSLKGLPEKLLQGENGFSEDDSTFLEILRIGSRFNRSDQLDTGGVSLSREAIQQGIHSALIEKNPRVLVTLLKIDEYFIRSQNANNPNPLPYALPSDHFRTAVQSSPVDPTFFQLLLRTSAESVPGDDSEITQWAMDLGNSLGDWLLDLMLRLPQQIEAASENPAQGSIFYMGRVNGQTEMGRRYLDEVLNVPELGSWMEETSFDVSGLWKVNKEDSQT